MKKLISFFIAIFIIMGVATSVKATTSDELADKIYEIGKSYGLTTADKLRVERYLADNPVTDSEADKIIAKVEEAATIVKKADVSHYSKLKSADIDKLKTIVNDAAGIVGLTVKFKAREVEFYKNGKLIEVARYNGSKLVYTGNSVSSVLVASLAVAVALAVIYIARKRKNYAK